MRWRLASYNIHAGVGRDCRFELHGLTQVLGELEADLIGLQEVVSVGPDGFALLDELARTSGMQAITGPTMMRGDASYGNALLTRLPWQNLRKLEFAAGDHEPRGVLSVEVGAKATPLTVAVTHLGLNAAERQAQIAQLLEWLPDPPAQVVVLGDLNEWWPWSRNLRGLKQHFEIGLPTPTFPTRMPLFALDRIIASPSLALKRQRHLSPTSRLASDHLPLLADISTP